MLEANRSLQGENKPPSTTQMAHYNRPDLILSSPRDVLRGGSTLPLDHLLLSWSFPIEMRAKIVAHHLLKANHLWQIEDWAYKMT